MPWSWARAPARAGPSRRRRERCLTSKSAAMAGAAYRPRPAGRRLRTRAPHRGGSSSAARLHPRQDSAWAARLHPDQDSPSAARLHPRAVTARERRLPARPRSARGVRRAGGAGAALGGVAGMRETLALPLTEAPDVALDLAWVELAPGKVHVRLVDEAPLVALQGHPLGEDVVRVGQPRRAVGPRLVRELDAVLVQQPAGLWQVGDDRAVRVDQVGVRDTAQVVPIGRAVRTLGAAAPHPQEAEVAVHRPLFLVDARLEQLAGALLGAPLTPGVVVGALRLAQGLAGPARLQLALPPRQADLPEQRQ